MYSVESSGKNLIYLYVVTINLDTAQSRFARYFPMCIWDQNLNIIYILNHKYDDESNVLLGKRKWAMKIF